MAKTRIKGKAFTYAGVARHPKNAHHIGGWSFHAGSDEQRMNMLKYHGFTDVKFVKLSAPMSYDGALKSLLARKDFEEAHEFLKGFRQSRHEVAKAADPKDTERAKKAVERARERHEAAKEKERAAKKHEAPKAAKKHEAPKAAKKPTAAKKPEAPKAVAPKPAEAPKPASGKGPSIQVWTAIRTMVATMRGTDAKAAERAREGFDKAVKRHGITPEMLAAQRIVVPSAEKVAA